jgi:hypothetical protein
MNNPVKFRIAGSRNKNHRRGVHCPVENSYARMRRFQYQTEFLLIIATIQMIHEWYPDKKVPGEFDKLYDLGNLSASPLAGKGIREDE